MERCTTNDKLAEALGKSIEKQYIVKEHDGVEINKNNITYDKSVNLIVSRKKKLEATGQYKGKKVAVLNFANAISLGEFAVYCSEGDKEEF